MPVSELPPRTPSRSASRAPVGFRRALSTGPTGMQQHSPNRRGAAVPPLTRSESQGRDSIDSSHLDGLYFEQEQQHQQWQQQRRPEERFVPSYPSQKVGIVDDFDYDSGDGAADEVERPLPRHGEYSAEEIALRRFMTTVAWGSGLAVVKHNRGKGRGRRLLKFNDEEGYLCWSGTFPPFHKTKVPAHKLLKASRAGSLVTVKMSDQADVAFTCARLTEAIVLETGLNGLIRACNSSKEEWRNGE